MDSASTRAEDQCLVVLFYAYFPTPLSVEAADALRSAQEALCVDLRSLKGRVLVSVDGVNGTLGGAPTEVEAYKAGVTRLLPPLRGPIDWKESRFAMPSSGAPFPDMRVKRVKEIVSSSGRLSTCGVGSGASGGQHISPEEFHATLAAATPDDDLVVLDVRNRFEVAVGHFVDGAGRAAAQPEMRTFEQFADYVDRATAPSAEGVPGALRNKRVVMYCTGGIRCETASAYLVAKGCTKSVSQLDGGIHRYLDAYPRGDGTAEGGFFAGKNFVFDQRIAVRGNVGVEGTLMEENVAEGVTESAADTAREAPPPSSVGACVECGCAWDALSPGAVCTVCVCLTLVCPRCRAEGASRSGGGGGGRRYEWFCGAHRYLSECFVHFIDEHDRATLEGHKAALEELLRSADAADAAGAPPPLHARTDADMARRDRRTLARQLRRLQSRIAALRKGRKATVRDASAARRCRHCRKEGCSGKCWGFWKAPPASKARAAKG